MIRMMDEINRYTEIINNGIASEHDIEEMRRLVKISSSIINWLEDQTKEITSVRYDSDTGFLEFEMQNTSGLDFKELEFDILADDTLHTVSFRNWKNNEYREVRFTHFFESTDDMSVTLQANSTAFELYGGTGRQAEVFEDKTGEDGSYPVKIPLGNWILKSEDDGSKKVVPLEDFFGEMDEDGFAPEDLLEMPICELGLSNYLRRADISIIKDLISCTEDEIKSIRNIGRKSLEEIREKLEAVGLCLKEPDDEDDIGEDTSYSVDVTGIVDQIKKALVPEDVSDGKDDVDSSEDQSADAGPDDGVKDTKTDEAEKAGSELETSRLGKARKEVLMMHAIAKSENSEMPPADMVTAYLKYLNYNDDEIAYALQFLDGETSENEVAEELKYLLGIMMNVCQKIEDGTILKGLRYIIPYLNNIAKQIEEYPDRVEIVRQLRNDYLPAMISNLKRYAELEKKYKDRDWFLDIQESMYYMTKKCMRVFKKTQESLRENVEIDADLDQFIRRALEETDSLLEKGFNDEKSR